MAATDMKHMDYLQPVAARDVKELYRKEQTYRGSWKQRGGIGAFMMAARKWDRLESILQISDGCGGVTYQDLFTLINSQCESEKQMHRARTPAGYPVETPSEVGGDGTLLAEIRDLRRYLLLIEAEMAARGAVTSYSRQSEAHSSITVEDLQKILDEPDESEKNAAIQVNPDGSVKTDKKCPGCGEPLFPARDDGKIVARLGSWWHRRCLGKLSPFESAGPMTGVDAPGPQVEHFELTVTAGLPPEVEDRKHELLDKLRGIDDKLRAKKSWGAASTPLIEEKKHVLNELAALNVAVHPDHEPRDGVPCPPTWSHVAVKDPISEATFHLIDRRETKEKLSTPLQRALTAYEFGLQEARWRGLYEKHERGGVEEWQLAQQFAEFWGRTH